MSLSVDLRKRIIKAYELEEGSIRQLSKQFHVGAASVWRILSRYKHEGEIKAKSPTGRNRKIVGKTLKFLQDLVHKKGGSTLDELREKLAQHCLLDVSTMTIYRTCQRFNMHYKKNRASSRAVANKCAESES